MRATAFYAAVLDCKVVPIFVTFTISVRNFPIFLALHVD